jgi:hypothetical protein
MIGEIEGKLAAPTTPGGGSGSAGVVLMAASMTIFGLAPLLFGGLAEEGRLGLSQVGLAIPIQAFIMGAVNLGADLVLQRRHQRLLTLTCVSVLAVLQVFYIGRSGASALILCALCSVPQGLLLWIAMGVIARAPVPARLMAYSEIAITLLKLLVSSMLAAVLLPRWGIDAGFAISAFVVAIGFWAAMVVPDEVIAASSDRKQAAAALPSAGWIALAVVLLIWTGTMSIMSYLLPLASASGLSPGAAHGSFVAALIGQITGGLFAAATSKRLSYSIALAVGGLIAASALAAFLFHTGTLQFWAASAAFGFTFAFSAPFLMPMLIQADPSKRAASKFMGAALTGSALGPLLSSRVVGEWGAYGALYMAAGSVALAFVVVTALQWLGVQRDMAHDLSK